MVLMIFSSFLFAKETDYLTGKNNPSKDSLFTEVEEPYAKGKGLFLRKEAYGAFVKMALTAKKDRIHLTIVSAARDFNAQKAIWEAKWTGSRKVEGKNLANEIKDPQIRAQLILRYSSMPGTSRHHWGSDMDLNSVNPDYFEGKEGRKIYAWLKANAPKYGFCQPYTAFGDGRNSGYQEEKWHWSYTPLSKEFLSQYLEKINVNDFKGFKGSETAKNLDVIEKYVAGVNTACR